LTEVASLPFDPSNLWTLHQFYYSPSQADASVDATCHTTFDPLSDQLMEIETAPHKKKKFILPDSSLSSSFSSPTQSYDDGDERTSSRPNKRQSNRLTMTRIAAYPRVKVFPSPSSAVLSDPSLQIRLEKLKSISEQRVLTTLRQLRCIEQYIDQYKDQYPYFIEIDIESIILDRNGF
jgi:hypothetical protein